MGLLYRVVVATALAVAPIPAASFSYVVLQHSQRDSLIRVSADGKDMTTIATGIDGSGLALDADGNYIVVTRSKVLRVTPSGIVSTIVEAPGNAVWAAVALDTSGNIIIADGRAPDIWRVSADGTSLLKVATFPGLTYPVDRAVALSLDAAGEYMVLVTGNDSRLPGLEVSMQFFLIQPDGKVNEVALRGPVTRHPTGILRLADGSLLFTNRAGDGAGVYRLSRDGDVAPFAHLPDGCDISGEGMGLDPATGDAILAVPLCRRILRITANGSVLSINTDPGRFLLPFAVVVEPARY